MKERVNSSVQLVWPDKELVISDLNLKTGECAVIPFGLKFDAGADGAEDFEACAEVILEKTNASLLCHLGSRYFFYTDAEPVYQWKGEAGDVVTLTVDEANRACRLQNALFITEHADSCMYEKGDRVYLISSHEKETIKVYYEQGGPVTVEMYFAPVKVEASAVEVKVCGEMTAADGAVCDREEAANGGYREYLVRIGDFDVDKVHQLYLETDYAGDRAEVYVDGKLVDDWFTIGETWHMALKRFGYPKELKLRVYSTDAPLPNPYDNQVYYDLPVEKGCELRGVKVIAEYVAEV